MYLAIFMHNVLSEYAALCSEQSVYLIEHVKRQECEAQIVEHQDASAGVRLPVLHVLGPRPHDQKVRDRQC